MNALIIVLAIVTAFWGVTIILLTSKNKELDKLSDKLCEKDNLCHVLAEAIEEQVAIINNLKGKVKFYEDAYRASEEVRKKLVAERNGNE